MRRADWVYLSILTAVFVAGMTLMLSGRWT